MKVQEGSFFASHFAMKAMILVGSYLYATRPVIMQQMQNKFPRPQNKADLQSQFYFISLMSIIKTTGSGGFP